MSPNYKAFIMAIFATALIMAGIIPAAAQQYDSPVILVNGGGTFTVEDAVNYTAYEEFAGQNMHVSVITAQLYLNGKPYKMANIPVVFSSDNDSVAVLEPYNRTRPSDENGQAKILLIANNTVGTVNITATSHIMYQHDISDTCTVRVVGWGTVSGMVTDKNRNGVPDAVVTLWHWNGTANNAILKSPDNPQLSNDGKTAAIGTYTYTFVPQGQYNVTAEKDGHMYFAMVDVEKGTYTANVAIPDYVYVVPAPLMPTPAATAEPSATATPEPTPAETPGFGMVLWILSIGAVIVLLKRYQ
ncbi:carboxypeptidase regulatory-like domain-containing protein [Methanocella sp. CWC-04]|uniref:Carboxypeptidase regulatory-like domain-containing protein n=1 Tax=Methanooceanicella nereidis TaxID=2052831 RepID=A0AAP2RB76_9EURY|nr:carboxypeptidase-like regulatory domain-containing protein [Methanocella sp. CWC-04]MCD1293435.1 carboxypeptidase regulatory-like domain-containing protein [Methanocella sp. CWC-04]